MRALASLDRSQAARLAGVALDLDDTLLDHGELGLPAYTALHGLARAGLRLAVVTGRPAGFGEVCARQWPIDLAVSENGAVAHARRDGRTTRLFAPPAADAARLAEHVAWLRARHPDVPPADDVGLRLGDFTFDLGEHAAPDPALVEALERDARARGLRTTRSSVHLHVTLSGRDKASGAVAALAARFGRDVTALRSEWLYVGDSENDAPCFAAFATSVAVANVRGRFSLGPRFVTRAARGAGFAELAEFLLEARAGGLVAGVSPGY